MAKAQERDVMKSMSPDQNRCRLSWRGSCARAATIGRLQLFLFLALRHRQHEVFDLLDPSILFSKANISSLEQHRYRAVRVQLVESPVVT